MAYLFLPPPIPRRSFKKSFLPEKNNLSKKRIHQHPELSNSEARTAKLVAERLRKLKVDSIQKKVATHGVVALICGKNGIIALRANLDALPIEDRTKCSGEKRVTFLITR